MIRAVWTSYTLQFNFLARTSRAAMSVKPTYFIKVWDDCDSSTYGIGECNLFKGLSADDVPNYEEALTRACDSGLQWLPDYSSIIFGAETALADLRSGGKRVIFQSDWTNGMEGIPINGLIWMGSKEEMLSRIEAKINQGFRCLKLKIGGIDFDEELSILSAIRSRYGKSELELRLDANGAFTTSNALHRIRQLSQFCIHSLEQPIKAGQTEEMAEICKNSPIPIALDEELIGVRSPSEKAKLLDCIRPQYIILKPALCGGFEHSNQWIDAATARGIGWWATSALESNVGLNAIAQWIAAKGYNMPQGLGTGGLYVNNIESPIVQKGDRLYYEPNKPWGKLWT